MMRRFFIMLAACVIALTAGATPKTYQVVSPDGSLKAEITVADGDIQYSVVKDDKTILTPSKVAMRLADDTAYDGSVRLLKAVRTSEDRNVAAQYYKKSEVRENYNQLSLRFKTFDLLFRVYDAGVAYRFVSKSKTPFKIVDETAQFVFPADWNMYVPYVKDKKPTLEEQFYNSFENLYEHAPLSAWDKERIAFVPLMVESPDLLHVLPQAGQ